MTTTEFWLLRRRALEDAYASMSPPVRAGIDKQVAMASTPLAEIFAREVRPGNGLEKVIERHLVGLRLQAISRAVEPPSVGTPAFQENPDGRHPGMILVPGGETTIGLDSGFFSREEPARLLDLGSFWLDTTCVTNADFEQVFPSHKRDVHSAEDSMPVVSVTWFDAHKYCAAVGKRLPTGAEWEHAARGPGSVAHSHGPYFERGLVHVWPAGGASKVDDYPATSWGLYQMCGNVWEWTADVYVHRLGPDRAVLFNLARGGSWRNCAEAARPMSELCLDLAHRSDTVGFRCACSAVP